MVRTPFDLFYQVLIDPKDAPAMRFLWWEDEDMTKEIALESEVHIFGAGSSPTVANYTLQKHARVICNRYPINVYLAMKKAFYVDDFLASVSSK